MVAIGVVVVIVPITIIAPTTGIGIPPAVAVIPAVRAGLSKFVAPVFCLLAAWAMVVDGFVKFVVGFVNSLLARILGAEQNSSTKEHRGHQSGGGQGPANPVRVVHR